MKDIKEQTVMDLAKMQLYLLKNNDFRGVEYVPSLDGQGKMSKSKGGKSVINLTDQLEEINKKVSKIPSNEENYHVFVSLFFAVIPDSIKQLINATTLKLFYDSLPAVKRVLIDPDKVFCPSNISLIEMEYQHQKSKDTGWI